MEQRQNEGAGETGDLRENPTTSGTVRHDSHFRKSGVDRPGIEPGSPWWEASSLTAHPEWPHSMVARPPGSGLEKEDKPRGPKKTPTQQKLVLKRQAVCFVGMLLSRPTAAPSPPSVHRRRRLRHQKRRPYIPNISHTERSPPFPPTLQFHRFPITYPITHRSAISAFARRNIHAKLVQVGTLISNLMREHLMQGRSRTKLKTDNALLSKEFCTKRGSQKIVDRGFLILEGRTNETELFKAPRDSEVGNHHDDRIERACITPRQVQRSSLVH
ncbi:hypothetical protein PR048_015960 [Dryococelus australis]|uniref:Uncharacterized protein n=1 Tax=Dryococelus australis TaxID=614101 RepID=A0ABQ9HIF2_9NEOP|nr:hypothetical protein PR048_015960 [Dryococelus australis]